MDNSSKFLEALARDPNLISKLVKSDDLAKFKEKYEVTRASPLKCPACRGRYFGSLWYDPGIDPMSELEDWDGEPLKTFLRLTCRRCRLTFVLECETFDLKELIEKLRLVNKGDEEAIKWFDAQKSL